MCVQMVQQAPSRRKPRSRPKPHLLSACQELRQGWHPHLGVPSRAVPLSTRTPLLLLASVPGIGPPSHALKSAQQPSIFPCVVALCSAAHVKLHIKPDSIQTACAQSVNRQERLWWCYSSKSKLSIILRAKAPRYSMQGHHMVSWHTMPLS